MLETTEASVPPLISTGRTPILEKMQLSIEVRTLSPPILSTSTPRSYPEKLQFLTVTYPVPTVFSPLL